MEHSVLHYQHTSKTTTQGAHCPILEGWGSELPTGGSSHPSPSQRGYCVTRLHGHYAIAMETMRPGPFRWKANPTIWAQRLFIKWWLIPWICVELHSQHGFSNTPSHKHSVYNPIWKENMWVNTHSPPRLVMKTRNEWGRTPYEHPSTWEGPLC